MHLQTAAIIYHYEPTPQAEQRVVNIVEPKLGLICKTILSRLPDSDTLQDARLASVFAIRSYNPDKGMFSTILPYHIRKAIYRNDYNLIRIPEYRRLQYARLERLKCRYVLDFDRYPSNEEAAGELELPLETIEQVINAGRLYGNMPAVSEDHASGDHFASVEASADISRAIDALERTDPAAAKLARLHFLNGRSVESIARENCLHLESAERLIGQAREFLRERLAGYA